jgi:protein O-GlcNAc transferase
MDPTTFDTWMNVLRARPNSVLWLILHHDLVDALARLRSEAAARGVASWRVVGTSKEPWIEHVRSKGGAAELVLDTSRLSNGHTSVADALWGGVPIVTLQGERMGARVSEFFYYNGCDSSVFFFFFLNTVL